MRLLSRVAIVLGAIVIFSGITVSWAQDAGTLFQRAGQLERAGKPVEALNEYRNIARDQEKSNPETAAEALYQGGLFAQDPKRYPGSPTDRKQAMDDAADLWLRLLKEFKSTRAYRKITDPQPPDAPTGALVVLLQKAGRYHDAMGEFNRIVGENRRDNRRLAAEALYRGGLYSKDWGNTPDEKRQGEDTAVTLWKQLRDDYQGTPAYDMVVTGGLLQQLEDRIDKRNSKDWKYQILNSLVLLTGKNPAYSYALALILLAVIVKLVLLPFTKKQYAGMREMQRMQPLIKELQGKYKGAELSQKTMELYKEHGVNPFASCLPTLLQLPFLFLIFAAIREYEFAFARGKFLWVGSSLAEQYPHIVARNLALPDVPLLALYAITNYATMKLTPATDPQQQQQQNMMAILMSGMFFWMFLTYKWSSAFVLYWLALNLLSIWQQYEYVYKPHKERMKNGVTGAVTAEAGTAAKNGAGVSAMGEKPAGANKPPARVRPRNKKRR